MISLVTTYGSQLALGLLSSIYPLPFAATCHGILTDAVLSETPYLNSLSQVKIKKMRVGIFPIDGKNWLGVGEWPEYKKTISKL